MELAFIGMGANVSSPVGPPDCTLAAASNEFARLGTVVCQSSLYSTEPVGFAHQPRFVNAVVGLETGLTARELLEALLRIELAFGRDRSSGIRNGPRPLDLDLLLLGNQEIHLPGLDLPHPRMHQRLFVLVPLNDIAPDWFIAPLRRTVKELFEGLLSGVPDDSNAILPFNSDLWHAVPCRGGGVPTEHPDADSQG